RIGHRPRDPHLVDVDPALPVVQLANVEVMGLAIESLDPLPAEEDVACGLHETLAGHHPLAMVAVLALAQKSLEDRLLGLLDLEDERIVIVAPHEEDDVAAGPHAADPDDL